MQRFLAFIVIQLVAAAIGIGCLVAVVLDNLMRSLRDETQTALFGSLLAIVVLTLVSFGLAARGRERRMTTLAMSAVAALTLIVGLIPGGVEKYRTDAEIEARRQENLRFEAAFQAKLDAQRKDVTARITVQYRYTPEEALDFIDLVNSADLRYRSLPDHSMAAFALLRQALAAKIVDPNGRLQAARFGTLRGEPLFMYFYKVHIGGKRNFRVREWELLKILVENGADLTVRGADLLVADLNKTATVTTGGIFMQLD